MWPFAEKKAEIIDLTTEGYRRWIRAQRPQPLLWFLGLTELEQEGLAGIGDEYLQECASLGFDATEEEENTKTSGIDKLKELLGKTRQDSTQIIEPSFSPLPKRDAAGNGIQEAPGPIVAGGTAHSFLGRKPDAYETTPPMESSPPGFVEEMDTKGPEPATAQTPEAE